MRYSLNTLGGEFVGYYHLDFRADCRHVWRTVLKIVTPDPKTLWFSDEFFWLAGVYMCMVRGEGDGFRAGCNCGDLLQWRHALMKQRGGRLCRRTSVCYKQ